MVGGCVAKGDWGVVLDSDGLRDRTGTEKWEKAKRGCKEDLQKRGVESGILKRWLSNSDFDCFAVIII